MRTDVIFNTDAASGLGRLPDNFIDCIVASPPYWQLRDYGLSPILLGGRQKCEHDFDDYAICRSCGGWLGQLGQEPSREMFLEHLMGIFDECRRVLKSTGTLWVNLGDSYSKLNKYNRTDDWPPGKNAHCLKTLRVDLSMHRVPHKSLCNIPGLFAEMMILRGWILRNEIIWYSPQLYLLPSKTVLRRISRRCFSSPNPRNTTSGNSSNLMPGMRRTEYPDSRNIRQVRNPEMTFKAGTNGRSGGLRPKSATKNTTPPIRRS